jgi:hypothetical protein
LDEVEGQHGNNTIEKAPATDRDGTTACCDGPAFEAFGARKVSSGLSTLPDWGWRET